MARPKEDQKRVEARVSKEDHRALKVAAAQAGLTMEALVAYVVHNYVDQAQSDLLREQAEH